MGRSTPLPCPGALLGRRDTMPLTLLDRLNRRFGRYAIPHLTAILLAGQVVLYVASYLPQGIKAGRIDLNPALVMQGEVWRLVTFMFLPLASGFPLLAIIYFLFFYFIGSTLEAQWGDFRFNVFILIGWLANVAAAFLCAAIIGRYSPNLAVGPLKLAPFPASNMYLYSSLFLAFARLYPDFIINLFYILPIRVKWLALVEWLGFAYLLVRGPLMVKLLVLATIANYLAFFGRDHWREFRQGTRRRSFQAKATKATSAPRHVCRVCGASSDQAEKIAFRYCSKCAGQCCYCPDHIRNHEHITTEETASQ